MIDIPSELLLDGGRDAIVAYLVDSGVLAGPDDLAERPDVAVELQRQWHRVGGQGCNFARFLSDVKADENRQRDHGWLTVIAGDASPAALNDADEEIEELVANPLVHAISLLLPGVIDSEALVSIVRHLGARPRWLLEEAVGKPPPSDDMVHVGLRRLLNEHDARGYVLGLGPFDFLPATRRAPIMEMVFVAKPITEHERRRDKLNDADEAHAHLAYMPINIEPNEGFTRVWLSTEKRRLTRLGGADSTSARAKVTYALPRAIWVPKRAPVLTISD